MSDAPYLFHDAKRVYTALAALFNQPWTQEKRTSMEAIVSPLVDALEAGNHGAHRFFEHMDLTGTAEEFVLAMARKPEGFDCYRMCSMDYITAEWMLRRGMLRIQSGLNGAITYFPSRK